MRDHTPSESSFYFQANLAKEGGIIYLVFLWRINIKYKTEGVLKS